MGGSFGDEFVHVTDGVMGFAQGAFNLVAPVGRSVAENAGTAFNHVADGIMSGVTHPAGNPWFQGIAAVIAIGLVFGFGPQLLARVPGLGGDGFAGRTMRGLVSLALAAGLGMSAAAGVGMFRDGPTPGTEATVVEQSAVDDEALNRPAQPQLHTS